MDSKKKILFLMPFLGCGGVETTLFSLLSVIDREKYDITLLLLEKKGAFLDRIPSDITIKEIDIPEKERGVFFGKKKQIADYLFTGRFIKAVKAVSYNFKNSLTEDRKKNAIYFKRIADTIPALEEEYDLAIDYFGYATFTTFYIAEKVNAKVKVSWLHSILSRFSPQDFSEWYKKMDGIFACSEMVKADFELIFPDIKNVCVFYNIIDPNRILNMSNDDKVTFADGFAGIRILTVGRLCEEKGTDIAIEAYKRLLSQKYNIKWYFIGDGSNEYKSFLKGMLTTREEKENVVFLGIQDNPYSFMKQCDIYVQPSRFEGYCTTINEARIINCPIVMTDVSGAREQVSSGTNGIIVNKNAEDLVNAVGMLIENPEQRLSFRKELSRMDFDTRKEILKLYSMIE